jgi:hypothetical protein
MRLPHNKALVEPTFRAYRYVTWRHVLGWIDGWMDGWMVECVYVYEPVGHTALNGCFRSSLWV